MNPTNRPNPSIFPNSSYSNPSNNLNPGNYANPSIYPNPSNYPNSGNYPNPGNYPNSCNYRNPSNYPNPSKHPMNPSNHPIKIADVPYEADAKRNYSNTTKFDYARGLVESPKREHQVKGVQLLTEIHRVEPWRRECLYYLALGHYKMGNFDEAKRFESLLDPQASPQRASINLQAQSPDSPINTAANRGGHIGFGIAGATAAVGAVLLVMGSR